MEYVIGLIIALGGGVFYLFTQNQKLKSDGKLADLNVEDAKLETKQEALSKQTTEIEKTVDSLKPTEVKSDQSAEDFWKDRK